MFDISKVSLQKLFAMVWKVGNFGEYDDVTGGKGSKEVNDHLKSYVICLDCLANNKKFCEIKRGQKSNTSNLEGHIHSHHSDKWKEMNAAKFSPTLTLDKFLNRSSDNNSDNKNDTVICFIEFMVSMNLPYSTVENFYFRMYQSSANVEHITMRSDGLGVSVNNNKTLKCVMDARHSYLQSKLGHFLLIKAPVSDTKVAVSSTIDTWTDDSKRTFQGLTIHFLTADLVPVPVSTDIWEITGRTTAELSAIRVDYMTKALNVKCDAIVMDADATNVALSGIIEGPSSFCIDHRLEKVFSKTCDSKNPTIPIGLAKSISAFFNSSSQALANLQKTTDINKKMKQHCVTRWWSLVSMLERLLLFKEGIKDFNMLGINRAIKCNDIIALNAFNNGVGWLLLEEAFKCMEPIRTVEKLLEGDKYVTISLAIPLLRDLHERLLENKMNHDFHADIQEMSKDVYDAFIQRFGTFPIGIDDLNAVAATIHGNAVSNTHHRGAPKGFTLFQFIAAYLDTRNNLSWIEQKQTNDGLIPNPDVIKKLNMLVVELAFNLQKYGNLGLEIPPGAEIKTNDVANEDTYKTAGIIILCLLISIHMYIFISIVYM